MLSNSKSADRRLDISPFVSILYVSRCAFKRLLIIYSDRTLQRRRVPILIIYKSDLSFRFFLFKFKTVFCGQLSPSLLFYRLFGTAFEGLGRGNTIQIKIKKTIPAPTCIPDTYTNNGQLNSFGQLIRTRPRDKRARTG